MRYESYVIGFHGKERLATFISRNSEVGEFVAIDAVDGRALPVSLVTRQFAPAYVEHQLKVNGLSWLQGTLGCMLSHIKAIERALATDLDYVVIAEDDANFRDSPDAFCKQAAESGFDLVYLNDRMMPANRNWHGPSEIVPLSARTLRGTGTEGYILSRRAMEVLLDQYKACLTDGMPTGYDGFLQSSVVVEGESVEKPGGNSILRWLPYRTTALKVGVALPTIVAHEDNGVSIIRA